MMAAPQTSVSGNVSGGNVRANNFAASNNVGATNYRNGQNYASTRGDHDHDHGRGYGYGGGYGGGGLYAFEPGYDNYDYDDEYAGNSCYQPRWIPTPYGMRWRNVWVCD
jgi:hypothetical protein